MAETTDGSFRGQSSALPLRVIWLVGLSCAALLPLAFPIALAVAAGGPKGAYWTYAAGLNAVSWFDTGFARRELAGTIIRLFGAEPMAGTAWFHLAAYFGLAANGVYLCTRRSIPLPGQVALGAVLIAILAHLGPDVGRPDAAVMVCGLWAAWAAREGRWASCAASISIALLFHETGLLVLVPLVGAVAWKSGSWRRWRSESALLGAALMTASLIAYVMTFQGHPDIASIARRVQAEFWPGSDAEMALFANLTGFRGMLAAACTSLKNPLYGPHIAAGAVLCALVTFALYRHSWRAALLASLPAFLFLSLIGTDVGRWATMGVFCIFALATIAPDDDQGTGAPLAITLGFTTLLLMSAAADFRTLPFTPIPLLDRTANAFGTDQPNPHDALSVCDPAWRSAIGL